MFLPLFRFPPIFEQFLDFLENFTNVTFSRKNIPFSSAKISDDLFIPYFSKFPPVFQKFNTFLHTLRVFPPYFDHDAFMHHPMHVLDAPAIECTSELYRVIPKINCIAL